jgi:hypothetical protein
MARIKVTGYLDTSGMEPSMVDLGHETGLSPSGYEKVTFDLDLDDVEFVLENDD